VWQESFSSRAGFPQDHPLFAGHLPADRIRLRETLAPHDLVLAIGSPVFRQYPFIPGPFVNDGTLVAMVSNDPAEVHRSTADLAVLAAPGPVCAQLARVVPARKGRPPAVPAPPFPPEAPAPGEPLRAGHVFAAMAERMPRDAIVIEESPSSRPELLVRLPARESLGSLSPAMGGLGFALPAAIGLRMALPHRPVVAIVGDGSSLYSIQSLWSAAKYGSGALFVILANGGYAIMDRLAEQAGGSPPWPGFAIDVAGLARALGCEARNLNDYDELLDVLDDVLPGLGDRGTPLLLEVAVVPEETFAP
jgi:benzoylformate decarboxylase